VSSYGAILRSFKLRLNLMKSAVLEFQQSRAKRHQAEGDVDILKTIAELRSHLESLERAITAVEHLALAQIGEDATDLGTDLGMDLGKTSPSKKIPTPSKRKGRVVAFRRLRQPHLGKDTSNTGPG